MMSRACILRILGDVKIIAVTNIKGGVGKTTTAVNLAYLCAASGQPTVLWDLDPQGAATYILRGEPTEHVSAKKLLAGKRELPETLLPTRYAHFDLLPADFSYRHFDVHLSERKRPTERLLKMSRPLAALYAALFLDCPPGISLLSENVLRAADVVIVPLLPSPLSVRMLEQLREFIAAEGWTDLLLVPFFSMVDRRKSLHRELMESTRKQFPTILTAEIPYWSEIERMSVRRAPLPDYAPKSETAQAYTALWGEVGRRMGGLPSAPASAAPRALANAAPSVPTNAAPSVPTNAAPRALANAAPSAPMNAALSAPARVQASTSPNAPAPRQTRGVSMTPVDSVIVSDLTRDGRLVAALNHGNPILVQRDPASGEVRGVAPALARELAHRLGTPLEFAHFDSAGKVFDAIERWDVAFLAIDPARAAEILFTAPYVIIEGTYVVSADSPVRAVEDLDRPGMRIAVGQGSAHDLFLTRHLQQGQLVRVATSHAALEIFLRDGLEAAAGIRQPLLAFARTHPEVRVLDGSFTKIQQAMGTARGRLAGAAYLSRFIEEMKATGFVGEALRASGQGNAQVAPPV
jgi:cellulose biosynthesis protein BcsQ/ABC-type amino acid transport substrate-binding protein